MEIGIPLVAAGLLYVVNKQSSSSSSSRSIKDGFTVGHEGKLPNTDIPNRNYPSETPVVNRETDLTSKLSTNNVYDGQQVYTDKYFNPAVQNNRFGPNNQSATENASYTSLSGQAVDGSYFRHNNMVPYFGGSVRSRNVPESANESIMDNYTGSGSQTIIKKEQSPLFAPGENYQYAHGAPNQSDFYQSRVNPSMRMANVKPFQEEHVAPGLGLGYTTDGLGGFNSGMLMREKWLDKSVDDLRVANKPKASGFGLLGHEGPADSMIKKRGDLGIQEKNRVERDFEMGQERWFTTTGAEKGQALYGIPVDRFVNRPETTASYTGVAAYGNSAPYVEGEYMPSKHHDLGAVPLPVPGAEGHGNPTDGDYGIQGQVAYPNNRSSNHQDSYYGAFSGGIGAVIAPLLDIMRPSRRENTIGNLRPYQNPNSTVPRPHIVNPADRPGTTIRETTENSKFHLNVNANQLGGAYKVTQNQPINNQRDTTTDYYYAGGSSAGVNARQPRPYDAEYRQRNNDIKASTIDGRLVKGNMSLMNGDINMRMKPNDVLLKNRRDGAPMMPTEAPSASNIGLLQGGRYTLPEPANRNGAELLDQLRGNPYALSITAGGR